MLSTTASKRNIEQVEASSSNDKRMKLMESNYVTNKPNKWTYEEDMKLLALYEEIQPYNRETWLELSSHFADRSVDACRQHFPACLKQQKQNSNAECVPLRSRSDIEKDTDANLYNKNNKQDDNCSNNNNERLTVTCNEYDLKSLLSGYLKYGMKFDTILQKYYASNMKQMKRANNQSMSEKDLEQIWNTRILPNIKMHYVNVFTCHRDIKSNRTSNAAMNHTDNEKSCPLYGVTDIPFLIASIKMQND